jgi:hypothetical protein
MRVVKTEQFTFDGRDYEIRATFDDSTRTYEARGYVDGEPANPYSHSVHWDTAYDFGRSSEGTLVEGIMKIAKDDVRNRIWEGYLDACRELKARGL